MERSRRSEVIYSVEHFYPKHPGHPIAPLTAEFQGYFRETGIGASHLVIAGDNTGSIDLLARGETDFSMDAHPAMVIEANAQGGDLFIIGSYRNGLPFSIAAPPGKLEGAAGLKGKRFATNRRLGAGERTMRMVYEKLGLDPDGDMEVVLIDNEGVREKIDAIQAGAADFLFYHHNGPQGRVVREHIQRGDLIEVLDLSRLFPDYVVRSMAASGRMLRERPETVQGFVRGVMQAHRYLKNEPTGLGSVEILKRALKVDSLAGSGVEAGIPKSWAVEPRQILTSVAGVQFHVDELKSRGKIDPGFRVEQVVRSEPAEAALRECGAAPP